MTRSRQLSNPDLLGCINYEVEASWAEANASFNTHRLPIVAPVDCSGLVHNKSTADYTEQYRGAGHAPVLMTQGGSFSTKFDLHGHGSTTAGSPSVDAVETFLGIVFGNVALSLTTSQTLTGGTAAVPTTSGATGVVAGGLVRVGALGDGDGDGQMYPVSTQAASALNLLAALRGAPVNGAVLYPVVQFYTNSSPTSVAITGTRFQLMTANTQYHCFGCWPMSVTLSGLSAGERPQIEITWGVSRWTDTSSDTFPSIIASNRYLPSPIAGGSLHVQDVGTVTRNELVCRNFSVEYNLGTEALRGPGGVGAYQDIVGAVRTGAESCKVSFTVDSGSAGTVTLANWGRGTTNRFIMWTGSTTAGSAIGIKLPKVCSSTVPVQIRDGSINRVRFEGDCYTSDTLTSELTRARMVLGYA